MQKSTRTTAATQDSTPFPINCFLGIPAELAIKSEDNFHPLKAMFSFKVMDYELRNILDPCINHPKIDKEIKAKLAKKRIDLEKQRQVSFALKRR